MTVTGNMGINQETNTIQDKIAFFDLINVMAYTSHYATDVNIYVSNIYLLCK